VCLGKIRSVQRTRSVAVTAAVTAAIGVLVVIVVGALVIRRGFSARDEPSAVERAIARAARSMAVPREADRMPNPVAPSADVLAEARAHFADHCATCHANDGSGHTPIGRGLYPKPPDMRLPATQKMTDGELYYTIHNGVRLTGMPAFGRDDSDVDSWKLVHFIRHLPALTDDELLEMRGLNPKTPDELEEERQEREFLAGGDEATTDRNDPFHHH